MTDWYKTCLTPRPLDNETAGESRVQDPTSARRCTTIGRSTRLGSTAGIDRLMCYLVITLITTDNAAVVAATPTVLTIFKI
jgi:hypothetical protein